MLLRCVRNITNTCVVMAWARSPNGCIDMQASCTDLEEARRPEALPETTSAVLFFWMDLRRGMRCNLCRIHQRVATGNGGVADYRSKDNDGLSATQHSFDIPPAHTAIGMWESAYTGYIHRSIWTMDLRDHIDLYIAAQVPDEVHDNNICRWAQASVLHDDQAATC